MCLYTSSLDRYVSNSIARTGAWEKPLVSRMVNALRAHSNSTLLDIGGNIGYYTLAAARAAFDVHVFEPVPRNAEMIRASVERNALQSRVQLHTCALSDANGELSMGVHANNQGGVAHIKSSKRAGVRIPALRLDDVMMPETRPVYIKIDIEGGECKAFEGMQRYLRDSTRIIGFNMEFRGNSHVTRKCCPAWTAPGGVFDILYTRNGLCPNGVSYANVCASSAWDLIWSKC